MRAYTGRNTNTYRAILIAVVAISVLVPTSVCPGEAYEIIDLGLLPYVSQGHSSGANAINNTGDIVGSASWSYDIYGHTTITAVRFDPDGAGAEKLHNPGSTASWAQAVSDAHHVVGAIRTSSSPRRYGAMRITDTGGHVVLGTLGGNESLALSVNNSGEIVGWAEDASGKKRATLFDPSGVGANVDLGALPGADYGYAAGINDSRQIVGHVGSDKYFSNSRATLFDPSGGAANVDLGTLGGTLSEALAVNNAGQIVGTATLSDNRWNKHATLFDASGNQNNVDLGTLGGQHSSAFAISENGKILGYADTSDEESHLTLFHPTDPARNVNIEHCISASESVERGIAGATITDINNVI